MDDVYFYCSQGEESTSGRDSYSEASEGSRHSAEDYRTRRKTRKGKLNRFLNKRIFTGQRNSSEEHSAGCVAEHAKGRMAGYGGTGDGSAVFSRSKTELVPPRRSRGDLPVDYFPRSNTFHLSRRSGSSFPLLQRFKERISLQFSESRWSEPNIYRDEDTASMDTAVVKFNGCLPIPKWRPKASKHLSQEVPAGRGQGRERPAEEQRGRRVSGDSLGLGQQEFTAADFMAIWGSCGLSCSSQGSGSAGPYSPKGVLEAVGRMRGSGGSGSDGEVVWTLEKLASVSFGRCRSGSFSVMLPSPRTCEKLRKEIEEACNPNNIEAARIRIMRASYAAMDAQSKLDQLQLDPLLLIVERNVDFPRRAGHWRQHSVMTIFSGRKSEAIEEESCRFRRSTSLPVHIRI